LIDLIKAQQVAITAQEGIIQTADTELTAHAAELAEYDEIAKKLSEKQAQLTSLKAQYPDGIKVKQAERELEALTGTSPQEMAELEVLKTFKSEILEPAKWEKMQIRGYQEKASNPTVKKQLKRAMDARPHVPPAYLFMIRSIGGKEAIANTPEGHVAFAKLSKMIPPQLFMQVYLSDPTRRADLQTAFTAAHGRPMAINNASIFDEDFQEPAVRAAMLQGISKEYITQISNDLIIQARYGILGEKSDYDQDQIDAIVSTEASPNVEEKRKELADSVEREQREYARGMQAHVGIACEKALDVMAANGLTPAQAESAIRAVHQAMKTLGSDRDVTTAECAAGALLDQTFIDNGLAGLAGAGRADLVNRIRKSGISSEDIAPYARAEQAVVAAGIRREQAPYVVAAIKRASLIAGLNGRGVVNLTLESPPGRKTAAGTSIQDELTKIGLAGLGLSEQVSLLNSLPNENTPHTHLRAAGVVLAGTKGNTHSEYHTLVADRMLLNLSVDRTKPFTDVMVTPAVRAIIKDEYLKISIDIDVATPWTDQEVAEIIEKVRTSDGLVGADMDPQSNTEISASAIDGGFTADQILDVCTTLQDFGPVFKKLGLPQPVTGVSLGKVLSNGMTIEAHIKALLNKATGVATPAGLDAIKLARLMNAATPELRRDIQAPTEQKVDLISQVTGEFLKYNGSYHDAALLGVMMAELDTATVDQVRQAMEQVFHRRESRDFLTIMSRLTDPPRGLLVNKGMKIINDTRGFIPLYNANFTPAVVQYKDIPSDKLREISSLVLANRLGAPTHPHPGFIAAESDAHRDLFHAHMNQVQLERAAASLDATFWGLDGAQLTYEIEKKLGGDRFRQEALRYTQMIQERRAKQGFPQVAPTNSP
ncbi:hypothetical protein KBD81_04230, partial [Candidatus Woesebacteria bacterium]|nr:hypothetical protein [Candidatus Woesebacteria bacterium]